jgi:hypothetical protein
MSDCGGCNDKPGPSQAAIDRILSKIPTSVHAGVSLKNLGFTLPPDDGLVRLYPRPKFHEDGSIEYTNGGGAPPPEINGYKRDSHNPRLFHPIWPECVMRMQGTKMDRKTGAIDLVMVCNHPEVKDHFMKNVPADACVGCPSRKAQQNSPAQPRG